MVRGFTLIITINQIRENDVLNPPDILLENHECKLTCDLCYFRQLSLKGTLCASAAFLNEANVLQILLQIGLIC